MTTGTDPAASRLEDEDRLVQVRFQPLWLYIDGIREFCGFFTRTTFDDPEAGDRIGLVVHELVENAIKYSAHHQKAVLELTVYSRHEEIEITVLNSADDGQVEAFRRAFEAVRGGDPLEVYTAAMKRARGLPEDESGLGLPRVRYEGRMDLALDASRPGLVKISAKGKL